MKKIFTLIAFVMVINTGNGQILKSSTVYEFPDSSWQEVGFNTYTYNGGCNQILTAELKAYNDSAQMLYNYFLTKYAYGSGGNYPTQVTNSLADSTGVYTNNSRYTYTYYGVTAKVVTGMAERWQNGAWLNFTLYTNTYNGSGFKTDSLSQLWDSAGNAWVNVQKTNIVNNSAGQPVSSVTQTYLFGPPTDESRNAFVYNASGLLISNTTQFYLFGTGWQNLTRSTYTYNGSGKVLTWLIEFIDGDSFRNNVLFTYTYNGDGTLHTMLNQEWNIDDSVWVNNDMTEYTYGPCSALPLVLLNFTGAADKDNMLLTWNTSAEVNTSHFDIERSENGHDFTAIGTLAGKGNSSSTLKYAYADKLGSVLSTKIYYRLRMVDRDGSVTYSNIISLSTLGNSLQFTLHPNPATSFFKVFTNKGKGTITLRNVLGSTVLQQVIKSPGDQQVNTGQLSKGIYTVTITTGDEMRSQRIVIQ